MAANKIDPRPHKNVELVLMTDHGGDAQVLKNRTRRSGAGRCHIIAVRSGIRFRGQWKKYGCGPGYSPTRYDWKDTAGRLHWILKRRIHNRYDTSIRV